MSPVEKASARVARFDDLEFAPRFAFPEMCKVVEVAGLADGSELSGGFARFTDAQIPWQVRYDELILVIEGPCCIKFGGFSILSDHATLAA